MISPRIPDWRLQDALVSRGLRLIWSGFLQRHSVAALAQRLGVDAPHLLRAFQQALAATPAAVARAHAAGIREQLAAASNSDRTRPLHLKLGVRKPYDHDWVFAFLDKRSLPGLEEVTDAVYRRRITGNHWLSVRCAGGELHIELPRALRSRSVELVGKIAQVFDVQADSAVIDEALRQHSWLRGRVSGGIRVPGAWDGFETAVRAILGQQVSVARARDLAIDLMQRFASDGFPAPIDLVDADVSAIGMPGKRGAAVRELAAAVLEGRLHLDNSADPQQQFAALVDLPGIGPWTAGYVAMRIAGDANAFPRADWVILKQLDMPAGAAEKYSQAWAPWRAYALMYIWRASGSMRPAPRQKTKTAASR